MWYFIIGFIVGIALGRAYGWMKYHYPEFRAEIDMRVSQKRAAEAHFKAEETRHRLAEHKMYEQIKYS